MATLEQLADAIKRVEGYYPPGGDFPTGSIAFRNNNPGNIIYTSYYANKFGAVAGNPPKYSRFPTYAVGYQALKHQIELYIGRGLTLQEMISKWAPADDGNDPQSYTATLSASLGISPDVPLVQVIGVQLAAPTNPILADGGSSLPTIADFPPGPVPPGEGEPSAPGTGPSTSSLVSWALCSSTPFHELSDETRGALTRLAKQAGLVLLTNVENGQISGRPRKDS